MAQHRDRQDDEERDERRDVTDPPPLVPRLERRQRPSVDELAQRVPDEAPSLEFHVLPAGCADGDAEHLGTEPTDADGEEHAEDHHVLGLRLDADPVRPLHIAPHDRPHDAAEEHDPGEVAHERVRLIGAPVEELEILGHLMVDLEHGGDTEQDEEAEVDQRVHQSSR